MRTSRTRLLKTKIICVHICNFQKVHTYFFARLMNLRTFLQPSYIVCQVSKCAGKTIFCVYTLKK